MQLLEANLIRNLQDVCERNHSGVSKTGGNRETSLPGWRDSFNHGQCFCSSGVWAHIFSGSSIARTNTPGQVGPPRGPSHLLRTEPGSQVRLAGLCWEFELDWKLEELKMRGNAYSWRGVLSSHHLWGKFHWFLPAFWGLGLHAGCWLLPFYKLPHTFPIRCVSHLKLACAPCEPRAQPVFWSFLLVHRGYTIEIRLLILNCTTSFNSFVYSVDSLRFSRYKICILPKVAVLSSFWFFTSHFFLWCCRMGLLSIV